MDDRRYESPFAAVLTALRDRLEPQRVRPLGHDDRLDGCTALVTGANRGLGRAIAAGLARRGARVLLACRGDAHEALRETPRGSIVPLDLADLASCDRLVERLAGEGERLHVVVLNAGVVPNRARRTAQGLELQLGVNYLANVRLVDRLRAAGLLVRDGQRAPRLVVVSSESHRSPTSFELARLAEYDDYGIGGVMRRYGESKLLLTAWAQDLARRSGDVLAVHTICPGPVASGIAREAPRWSQPALDPVMRAFFADPRDAAEPVVYLACARALEGRSGLYFHRWREKEPSPLALDPAFGAALRTASARVLDEKGPA
jgi:NAD(P)-dependent dehydrogenase (short-subunit alcohol dehydrogenase family)